MPSPAPQRIVVPFAGHVIGQGFNSETGERVDIARYFITEASDGIFA